MSDYEKLGVFYLGRRYDLAQQARTDELILYDSKDLVTHAVCVGMTGSGKTGLCLALVEEAAIDGIPAILIDPKGDLANLMLTFPELRPQDFEPWVNEDDARKKGLSPAEFAAQQAELWRSGLAEWGQDGERIRRLREAAEVVVYTPGSTAGLPVSILKSLAAPPPALLEDGELLRERIQTTVTSLLGMVGLEADPIQSREHILLATIFDRAWRQGQDLDLPGIIQQVQAPPVTQIGVLDLETFYPAKDRFGLVMALNNMLAAPGFSVWLEGEPLEVDRLLYTPAGKPRLAIVSIAHLSDAERMFFVSLLLNQVLGWVRAQSGTTSLRAIVYMDEISGFFPPVANPPSKAPLLTLLKQARAFGLGVVLATQNPVDLDYKGLANAGTWFIGRLQTERDKARVLEGLEGAAASAGGSFDRQRMEQVLAGLDSRIFLMNNVHEDAPVILQTRWVMSYLRGPLTRGQIKTLMDPIKAAWAGAVPTPAVSPANAAAPLPAAAGAPPADVEPAAVAAGAAPALAAQPAVARPAVPPEIPQLFVPLRSGAPAGATLVYQPGLVGLVRINFVDSKTGVDVTRGLTAMTPITDEVIPVDWGGGRLVALGPDDLERDPYPGAQFAELPAAAVKPKSYAAWSKDLVAWLYANEQLELWSSQRYKLVSRLEESERDFRIRLQQAVHEARDEAAAKLRQKYAPKIASLQERLRVAQQAVEREKSQAKQQQMQTAISFGATLLGAFVGRKAVSASTMGRATTAARGVSRAAKEQHDIERAGKTVEALKARLAELEADFKREVEAVEAAADAPNEPLDTLAIRPKKTNIAVQALALAWMPKWRDAQGTVTPAWE
ncbi:MAG: ATP-binding protein [Anaerolineales bacterium]|nr:ATP-binding protein [Anaerolineales bacterium]